LIIALFGLGAFSGFDLVAWTLGVGLAVLLHEFGHALTARAYGATGITVTLFALGGFTTWAPGDRPIGPGKRFFIAASGSAIGIAGGAALLGSLYGARAIDLISGLDGFGEALVISFVYAAGFWGLFNWLPMLPLDGGHMAQSLLELWVSPKAALEAVRVLTVVAAVAAGAYVWLAWDSAFGAIWVGIIAFSGFRLATAELQRLARPQAPQPDETAPDDALTHDGSAEDSQPVDPVPGDPAPVDPELEPDNPDPPAFPI
jgi:Zn-dependent protease